jgi:hypothetical protein
LISEKNTLKGRIEEIPETEGAKIEEVELEETDEGKPLLGMKEMLMVRSRKKQRYGE